MFKYLHCYLPETWEAQIKAGLINENSGIRFVQSMDVEQKNKFNILAKHGGALNNIIKDIKCPFYIDRLQGGSYIENYPYDMELVDEYREILGDNFWGFQMHEWMSNYASDIDKLEKAGCTEWTEEKITEAIFKKFPYPHLFLEAMNASEMAENGKPADVFEFIKHGEKLLDSRFSYVKGDLLICDSGYQALQLEIDHGVKRFMPEVGAQTPDTRVQVAYSRGMAKACGCHFGIYYETWQPFPTYSACFYNVDKKSEWNITGADFPFEATGFNGGSSRSLQRRIHLYSYMAGAEFISEEWGMGNTFYDWNDFVLSPYGEVKRDFIRFTEKYPDIGKLITPVAVALPKDLPVLDQVRTDIYEYLGNSIVAFPPLMKKIRIVREGIRELFCKPWKSVGTEKKSMLNCETFDAIDIVNEDKLKADNYKYIVDLTSGGELSSRCADKIVPVEDVKELLENEMPITVQGRIHKLVNRREDGTCFLMLLNNDGVYRTEKSGEILLHEMDSVVKLQVKNEKELTMLEGDSTITRNRDGSYSVAVPAGGWFFGKF